MRADYSTTDPQDERFDVYNPDGTPAGYAKARGLIHRDGDWHRALHLWIYGIDTGSAEPFVIFQRRSATKDTWPGAIDVAVGGHIRAGETLEQTIREADEEVGLEVSFNELLQIGRRFQAFDGPGYQDYEINEVFVVRCDWPLGEYQLHPDEVASIIRLTLSDAITCFRNEGLEVPALERRRLDSIERQISVRAADFVDTCDGRAYPLAVLEAIRSLVAGRIPVPFTIHS